MDKKETNLFNALAKFIEAMRLFIYTGLKQQYGEAWERIYCESLMNDQKEHWGKNLQEGKDPIQLIDYGNLKSFALNNRSFFERDFGRQKNNLPTIFNQISEARNMLNHYGTFDNDKSDLAYAQMIFIAKKLEMQELEESLRKLKNDTSNIISPVPIGEKPRIDNRSNSIISKKDAIKFINNYNGDNKLSNVNTVYSNINRTAPCWWLNIVPEKFNHSLNIILVSKDGLIWINLPKGSCYAPEQIFNTRKDNGKIDLRIGIEGKDYLRDYLSTNNFDFNPFAKLLK